MDTKLKNKYKSIMIFIIEIYSIALAIMTVLDVSKYRNMPFYNRGEIGITFIAIAVAISLFAFRKSNKYLEVENFPVKKIKNVYEKIPLDLRILLFVLYGTIMIIFFKGTNFLFNRFFQKIIILSITAIYIVYIKISLRNGISLFKDKDKLKQNWSKSLLYKYYIAVQESFIIRGVVLKVGIIIALSIIFGMLIPLGSSFTEGAYMIFYIIFVPYYIFKNVGRLNKIIKGTEEMVLGNLDYSIELDGKNDLAQLAQNINNMKSSFKESVQNQVKNERLKTELITNVSHDLKTPLTSIINYVNLLKEEELSKDEIEGYVGILDKKSQRLKVLIEDLFEISKLSSGTVELNMEKVDIVALLNQAMGEFDEKIRDSSLEFRFNASNQHIYVNLDGKKTWRVFSNLIGNALKYSQPNTRVYIDILEKENYALIIIKNISAYELDFNVDEIFERFKRGDKSRNTEGSGLGLAIARNIVELQGGKLSIETDGDLFKVIVRFIK